MPQVVPTYLFSWLSQVLPSEPVRFDGTVLDRARSMIVALSEQNGCWVDVIQLSLGTTGLRNYRLS